MMRSGSAADKVTADTQSAKAAPARKTLAIPPSARAFRTITARTLPQ
jgi:hypothetical protein